MKEISEFKFGHLFLSLNEGLWLLDTGAPTSFGATKLIILNGRKFNFDEDYMGLDAHSLSRHLGSDTLGIIGADILNEFDVLFDVPNKQVEFIDDSLPMTGHTLTLQEFMGIPIIDVEINGQFEKMFFDTGAQISYWQSDALERFPQVDLKTDFFPGVGTFDVQTYRVACKLDGVTKSIQCGALPGILGMTLLMAGVNGIIGNEIMLTRKIGYFPRTSKLIIT